MASVKREFSDEFLRDLHLLEYTALVPKLTNVITLKKRLGIPLTKEEILKELNNPRSPLYKYILDMITACLILIELTAEINNMQQAKENLRKEQIRELVSLEERLRELNSAAQFSFDEKLNYEKRLQELVILAAVVARKYEELKFWLQFFKGDDHDEVRRLIDERYDQIYKNLNRFNLLLLRTDLTGEERQRVEEYYDHYQRHLELSTPENKQKYIGQYLEKDAQGNLLNTEMAKQVLRKDNTLEELFEKHLDNIVKEIFIKRGVQNLKQENKDTFSKPQQEIHSKYDKKNNNKWQYLQLADELNNKLEKFFNKDEHGVIVSFDKIGSLLHVLHNKKHQHKTEETDIVDAHVDETLHSLLIHDSELDLTQFLKKWVENKMQSSQVQSDEQKIPDNFLKNKKETDVQHENIKISAEEHAEFLQTLKEAKEAPELAEDRATIITIEEAYKKISDNKIKDEVEIEKIISSFNSLAEKYPDSQNLTKLHENLSKFSSFIDPVKLHRYSDSGYDLA